MNGNPSVNAGGIPASREKPPLRCKPLVCPAVEEGYDLAAGAGLVRIKTVCACAGGDAVFRSPQNSFEIIRTVFHVGEGVLRIAPCGAACGAVEVGIFQFRGN